MLVIDLGGDGKITEEKEFVFTQWDPGATGDLAALKSAFDTNQNGKLDAGDARWNEFKIMVGETLISLTDLGIESIDLTPTGAGRVFSDGSAITGTSTFTRIDGTKGEVGDAVLASDAAGYLIKRDSVLNADGSTTTEISGLSKAGVLQFRESVTVSADKSVASTEFDDDGNGSYDRRQTSTLTVGADDSRTTVVSNFAKDGSLANSTTTIRSGDKSTVTTLLDADGDGLADERQVFVTNSGRSTSTTVEALSATGAILSRVVTSASADGLTRTSSIDTTGRGTFDLVQTESVVIHTDGSRTTTVTDASTNGTLVGKRVETKSANGQLKTIDIDSDGNGQFDERQVITATIGETAYVTKTEVFNGDESLRAQSIVNTGKDGLSTITEYDRNGDGVFEERISKVLSSAVDGSRTEVLTRTAPGSKSDSTTTVAPNLSGTTLLDDTNGDGAIDRRVDIVRNDQSTTTSTKFLNRAGSVIASEQSTASNDGMTVSVSYDRDGDGVIEASTSQSVTAQANGDRKTEIVNRTGSAGQISGSTIRTVSADGLTTVVLNDFDGNGVFERSSRDVTVLNADGSRVRRTSIHSADGQKLSGSEATISADRKTSTISEDFDGDGQTDRLQTSIIEADGRQSSTSVVFAGGVAIERTAATRSADGLTSTIELDADGNGTIDLRTLDVTAPNADGSRLQTLSIRSRDGSLLSTSTLNTSGNGLAKVSTVDRNGDGIVDLRTTDVTVLNQNGSKTRTLSNAIDGSLTTTVSGNGLSKTIAVDADGNGSAERTASEVTTFGADLSVTNTVTTTSGSGQLLSRTRTTIAADRNTSNSSVDFDGDGFDDQLTTSQVEANGFTTSSASTYVKTGDLTKLTSRVTTSVSANGLSTTQTVDRDGDGVVDKRVEKVKTLQSDGSVEERFTEFDASGAPTSEVTTKVLRGGVEKLTEWRADGINLSRKASESRLYADDGSIVDTVSNFKGDGALESKTTTSTSGNRRTTVANRDIDGDGTIDQVVRSALQADGSLVTTSEDLATNGIASSARRTVTTSANGLVKTTEFDANGDGLSEQRYQSAIVLNADGGKTESTTEYGANTAAKASHVVEQSGNGLRIQEKWDLNADGTFEKSRTSVTVLNADSSTAETVSEFEGASLAARYTSTSSANGLVRTKQWDINGDGVVVTAHERAKLLLPIRSILPQMRGHDDVGNKEV